MPPTTSPLAHMQVVTGNRARACCLRVSAFLVSSSRIAHKQAAVHCVLATIRQQPYWTATFLRRKKRRLQCTG
ncbi:MAG TPA: hypothetical protein VGF67_00495 [Ktedonobacteraceae bacterium]